MLCDGALYWTEVVSIGLLSWKGGECSIYSYSYKNQGLLCAGQSLRNHRGEEKNSKSPYLPWRYTECGGWMDTDNYILVYKIKPGNKKCHKEK